MQKYFQNSVLIQTWQQNFSTGLSFEICLVLINRAMRSNITNQAQCPICRRLANVKYPHLDGDIYRCKKCSHSFYNVSRVKKEKYETGYFSKKHKNWFKNPNFQLFKKINEIIRLNNLGTKKYLISNTISTS